MRELDFIEAGVDDTEIGQAFKQAMRGRDYGPEALANAWQWFRLGYKMSSGFVKGLGVGASLARAEARRHAQKKAYADNRFIESAEEYLCQCFEDLAEKIRNSPAPGHPRPENPYYGSLERLREVNKRMGMNIDDLRQAFIDHENAEEERRQKKLREAREREVRKKRCAAAWDAFTKEVKETFRPLVDEGYLEVGSNNCMLWIDTQQPAISIKLNDTRHDGYDGAATVYAVYPSKDVPQFQIFFPGPLGYDEGIVVDIYGEIASLLKASLHDRSC